MPDVIRCGLLYMLEAMRRVLLCMLEAVEVYSVCRGIWTIGGGGGDAVCAALYDGDGGGDALCAALYDGGCGGVLCLPEHVGGIGGCGGDALCSTPYAGGCGGEDRKSVV